jgi:SAM-dependent methyltransferase
MVHHNSCPLCLNENVSVKFRSVDHFISKEVFQIAQCEGCGFQFTQDYPDEKEIGRYYESDEYISHSDTSKGLSNKLYRFARSFMLRRKLAIIRKVAGLNSGSLLDIGSGTGHFAETMKNGGWDVKGIEINDKARSYSIAQFGLDIAGPEEMTTLRPESFDCITLWHVLEHFHDPFKYASEIKRLLKPDGHCVIALPNSNSYDARHYGEYWAAYDVPRHLWHFSPDTFTLFAEKTGFKVMEIRNLPLDVFYISSLSEKYKKSTFAFIKGMARAKFYAFKSLFNTEKSSSMIYILKKNNKLFLSSDI